MRCATGSPSAVRRVLPLVLASLVLLSAPLGPSPTRAAPDPDPTRVYLRDVKGIERAVDILASEARVHGVEEVLVALDTITFAPPPGRNEYTDVHDFAGDLPRWLPALEAWALDVPFPVRIVSTLGRAPLVVGEPGWQDEVRRQISFEWWADEKFDLFEPARRWMNRWMPKKGGMLVLIASDITPERWIDRNTLGFSDGFWRRKLPYPGTYWDEEAIGKSLAKAGTRLYVVAPEALFGDSLPLPALPDLPWASRPQGVGLAPPIGFGGAGPGAGTPQGPTTPGGSVPADGLDMFLGGGRFRSATPLWFPHYEGAVPFNNHTPSAYGHWSYARAAAVSGGRYLFYPFPPARWLDVCPRDEAQLRRLAPELGTRQAFIKARSGDRALGALCRASALVIDDTPWADDLSYSSYRRAKGWSAFESTRPVALTKRFLLRRKPYDLCLNGTGRQLHRIGKDLATLLPLYDRAMEILDRALARVRTGKDTKSHPRSIADLRLGRYWFAMSAFHLEALSIYLREVERFAPPGWDPGTQELIVTYVPTIKMSDCLDAYDGRTLPPEREEDLGRILVRSRFMPRGVGGAGHWKPSQVIGGQQGNLLMIPDSDPDFRAKRSLSNVLRYLDRRLMARALDMIRAARDVMAHHAKTPWGWTTYYSVAHAFVFLPVPWTPGRMQRPGKTPDEDTPDPPWTPTPRGGSSPGGPVTPR